MFTNLYFYFLVGIESKFSWINRNSARKSCEQWQSYGEDGFVDSEMVQIYLITNGLEDVNDGNDD